MKNKSTLKIPQYLVLLWCIKKIWVKIFRIKLLIKNPKSFNLTELDHNQLILFQQFVIHVVWTRQTMLLQNEIRKKSKVYESSIKIEHKWFFYSLRPEEIKLLNKYGLHDIKTELLEFISKWNYETLTNTKRIAKNIDVDRQPVLIK